MTQNHLPCGTGSGFLGECLYYNYFTDKRTGEETEILAKCEFIFLGQVKATINFF